MAVPLYNQTMTFRVTKAEAQVLRRAAAKRNLRVATYLRERFLAMLAEQGAKVPQPDGLR